MLIHTLSLLHTQAPLTPHTHNPDTAEVANLLCVHTHTHTHTSDIDTTRSIHSRLGVTKEEKEGGGGGLKEEE